MYLLLMLHFPLPEASIFLPTFEFCSSRVTLSPALALTMAEQSPEAPAPIIIIFSLFIGYYTTKKYEGE